MAQFFIGRPIFAWVIAIIVMLAGALSITQLPVQRYPTIAPPTVVINASYPGATAAVVEESVTQVIEQNMKGLDGLLYMSSNSASSGQSSITLTFDTGTDPDIAQVQVQNKLQLALPLLPQVVQEQGVNVVKARSDFLLMVGFVSEDPNTTRADLADFVSSTIVDPISRVDGVGDATVFGARYAMRIWLDPDRMAAYRLAPSDVVAAVRAQNQQIAAGQLGGAPAVDGQEINATITAQGRLQTPGQFRDIVLRSGVDGSTLRLGDVARVEIGAESYGVVSRYNGQPATGLAVTLATGANALATADRIKARVAELEQTFPEGVRAVIPFDSTPFVRVSIYGVVQTLIEAVVLVFLVMWLFLQNFRATLIPTIAVPVVLLGTFAALAALGLSINMLTMFAMVLAIGLLVDDAIVVVENVERVMSEEGLPPEEATRRSMKQITGALVGIGLVLSAVFIPMAFLGGSTGVIYQQFSVTIVSAMALSVLVALVLTPALCATLLTPLEKGHRHGESGFFAWFNRWFDRGRGAHRRAVSAMLPRPLRWLAVFALMVVLMLWMFFRLPAAFLPQEDQGTLFTIVNGPVGSTAERTLSVLEQVEHHYLVEQEDAVESLFTVQGFSFGGGGQSSGMAFVKLRDWDQRDDSQSATAVAQRASQAFAGIRDAMVFAFAPPPLPELGRSAGFAFFLQDNLGRGHEALTAARNQLLGAATQSPLLTNVRPAGQEDAPQLRLDIDVAKAGALGVSMNAVSDVLAVGWGGRYIDDFIDRGRVKRVMLQGDAEFRMMPEDFRRWSVRNAEGGMVPLSSFASWRWDYGSPRLERFDGVPAVEINGEGAPGVSSSAAMAEIERLVAELPAGYSIGWTGASYQERRAGDQTPLLYTLSLLVVFLCLAALYESWTIPTAVLLVAPFGILGAVLANWLRGMERDVYFQVAMLTTVGLTSKNAIMIAAFAKQYMEEQGKDLVEATLAAVRDRVRPIIMTSLAFGFGVLPLAIASGAGSGAQNAIGTGVLGGMVFGTFMGLFFTPLFFVLVQQRFGGGRGRKARVGDADVAARAAP